MAKLPAVIDNNQFVQIGIFNWTNLQSYFFMTPVSKIIADFSIFFILVYILIIIYKKSMKFKTTTPKSVVFHDRLMRIVEVLVIVIILNTIILVIMDNDFLLFLVMGATISQIYAIYKVIYEQGRMEVSYDADYASIPGFLFNLLIIGVLNNQGIYEFNGDMSYYFILMPFTLMFLSFMSGITTYDVIKNFKNQKSRSLNNYYDYVTSFIVILIAGLELVGISFEWTFLNFNGIKIGFFMVFTSYFIVQSNTKTWPKAQKGYFLLVIGLIIGILFVSNVFNVNALFIMVLIFIICIVESNRGYTNEISWIQLIIVTIIFLFFITENKDKFEFSMLYGLLFNCFFFLGILFGKKFREPPSQENKDKEVLLRFVRENPTLLEMYLHIRDEGYNKSEEMPTLFVLEFIDELKRLFTLNKSIQLEQFKSDLTFYFDHTKFLQNEYRQIIWYQQKFYLKIIKNLIHVKYLIYDKNSKILNKSSKLEEFFVIVNNMDRLHLAATMGSERLGTGRAGDR